MSALPIERTSGLQPFTLQHFREWALELILDNDEPWILEQFQEDFIDALFSGMREAWLLIPEGNGKTTLVAGLCLYHCEFTQSAWVPVAAASKEQAEILFRQAEGFVVRSPRLHGDFDGKPFFVAQEGFRRIKCNYMHSRIQIFSAEDRTGDGVIPTLAIIDELHRQKNMRLYGTWRGKLDKRGGQLVTISTAGEPGSEFEQTRERIRLEGDVFEQRAGFMHVRTETLVLHDYSVPEGADVNDLALVKLANPLSSITEETLAKKLKSPTMTPQHWSRFTCNLPTRGDNAAVTDVEWAAAIDEDGIPVGAAVWVGIDVAWKWDTTAIVPLWMDTPEHRVFGEAIELVPPRDGSTLDFDAPRRALEALHAKHPIEAVVIDPREAAEFMRWIEEDLGVEVMVRPQANVAQAADFAAFMEALREGWLKHSGDKALTRHVMNAIVRHLPNDLKRFDRPVRGRDAKDEQDRRVIDALTAAAMVNNVAASNQSSGEPMVSFG